MGGIRRGERQEKGCLGEGGGGEGQVSEESGLCTNRERVISAVRPTLKFNEF